MRGRGDGQAAVFGRFRIICWVQGMLRRILLVSGFAMGAEDEQSCNQDDRHDQKNHKGDQKIHHRGSHCRATAQVVTDDKSLHSGHGGDERSGTNEVEMNVL